MITLEARELDKRVTIEKPVAAGGFRGAGSGTWAKVDDVWAGIVDQRPSRNDKEGGFPQAVRRARIRMRYRTDILAGMRIVHGDRILKIMTDPVELGRRSGLEMIAEEHRPTGNPA